MRASAVGPINRVWLFVLGALMVGDSLIGLAIGTGVLTALAGPDPVGWSVPTADDPVFGGSVRPDGWLVTIGSTALVGVVSVVIGALGLVWLLLQLPRLPFTPRFQLHDDAREGTVRVDATVLAAAAAERVRQSPDVTDADVDISGTAEHPNVRAEIEVHPRAELPVIAAAAAERLTSDLRIALDRPVDRLSIAFSVGQPKVATRQVVLDPRGARPWAADRPTQTLSNESG